MVAGFTILFYSRIGVGYDVDTITDILEGSSPPRVFQIQDLVQHALAYPGEMRVPPRIPTVLLHEISVLSESAELLGIVTNARVWQDLRKAKTAVSYFEITTKVFQLRAGIMAYWKEAGFPVGVSRSVEGNVVYAIKKGGECIAWKMAI